MSHVYCSWCTLSRANLFVAFFLSYVDQGTAASNNYTYATPDTFVMRADDQKTVTGNDRGRDSVRIASKKLYNDGVIVLDLAHMPEGSGTWPAFWTVTRGAWPVGGEIDIIEGVNDQGPNLSSLHTSPNCDMPASGRNMAGTAKSNQCDATLNSNEGCGVNFNNKPTSFGPAFNAAGGGWYVLRRSPQAISTWFFPRYSPNVPVDILTGAPTLDESLWGTPDADFPTTQSCTLEGQGGVMGDHEIIFDLTFCGDWAGNNYPGGPSSCSEFVDNNPGAYSNAYWQINSMRTYN